MGIKYQSKHTGAELDKALDYSLLHENKGSVHILDSSNESRTDLNTLINPGVYATQYVTNAKSGLDSFDCVIEIVNETIVNDVLKQSYTYKEITVYRYYKDGNWSDWWEEKPDFIKAKSTDMVSVNKPTIVIRTGGPEINSTPDPAYVTTT